MAASRPVFVTVDSSNAPETGRCCFMGALKCARGDAQISPRLKPWARQRIRSRGLDDTVDKQYEFVISRSDKRIKLRTRSSNGFNYPIFAVTKIDL